LTIKSTSHTRQPALEKTNSPPVQMYATSFFALTCASGNHRPPQKRTPLPDK
jgi:hypothetical protein